MKKVLIFYGSYGGGHLSAARNIKEYIDSNYEDAETFLVDCMEYINKTLNKVSTKAFTRLAKNGHWAWKQLYNSAESGTFSKISNAANKIMSIKLNKLIQDINPDVIISTHPFSSQMCAILKKQGKVTSELATVLTDYAPHSQWLMHSEFVNYFFVAHDDMKNNLIKSGIPENKIFATGIPLSNRFLMHYDREKTCADFGLDSDKKIILFFAGGEFGFGNDKIGNILKSLINNFSYIQVVAIAGKNLKAKAQFENIVSEKQANETVKILEYTNKVPELMSISDLVITKPGGLTTTECLASGLPIIAVNPIPGQEEENAKFLQLRNIGIWIRKDDNIEEVLTLLFNSPRNLRRMKINARLHAKKNSTKDICQIILGDINNKKINEN